MAKDREDRQSSDPALIAFSALRDLDLGRERRLLALELAALLLTAAVGLAIVMVYR